VAKSLKRSFALLKKLGVDVSAQQQQAKLVFSRLKDVFRRKRECDGDDSCLAKQQVREKEEHRFLRKLARELRTQSLEKLQVRMGKIC
jgi:hypothetical protein